MLLPERKSLPVRRKAGTRKTNNGRLWEGSDVLAKPLTPAACWVDNLQQNLKDREARVESRQGASRKTMQMVQVRQLSEGWQFGLRWPRAIPETCMVRADVSDVVQTAQPGLKDARRYDAVPLGNGSAILDCEPGIEMGMLPEIP